MLGRMSQTLYLLELIMVARVEPVGNILFHDLDSVLLVRNKMFRKENLALTSLAN